MDNESPVFNVTVTVWGKTGCELHFNFWRDLNNSLEVMLIHQSFQTKQLVNTISKTRRIIGADVR